MGIPTPEEILKLYQFQRKQAEADRKEQKYQPSFKKVQKIEYHKCKLSKTENNELYDDQAKCWFNIVARELGIKEAQGTLNSSKLLIKSESKYLMVLDDGRKGEITITHVTANEPRWASFAGVLK